jgi:hypothetical protein
MNSAAKIVLLVTMSAALLFGFLDPLFPDRAVSFKRLHIFLFNLLSGGSLIIFFSDGARRITVSTVLFFLISLAYALAAALSWYVPTLVLSAPLFVLVEATRIRRFSLLPLDFFKPKVPVHEKFHQASLLCLSCGIVFASLVILNNEYLEWIAVEKLTLDVFFLGYSFPISLITMSIMFSFMTGAATRVVRALKEISFWVVTGGVVLFFAFILAEWFYFEILISIALFAMVCVIFVLFRRTAPQVQQKNFLVSGMVFLLLTGLTGVLYIAAYFVPALAAYHEEMLLLHATVSLYGWNLSGLWIIIRHGNFPIRLNSALPISLHWLIVLILAPLGKHLIQVGVPAVVAYVAMLAIVMFSRGTEEA